MVLHFHLKDQLGQLIGHHHMIKGQPHPPSLEEALRGKGIIQVVSALDKGFVEPSAPSPPAMMPVIPIDDSSIEPFRKLQIARRHADDPKQPIHRCGVLRADLVTGKPWSDAALTELLLGGMK